MKEKSPTTLFDLIDLKGFRNRSAMYIGEKSISKLKLFMNGYEMCEQLNEIKTKDTIPPFCWFFQWICKYYNHSGSYYSWDGIILQNCAGDEAKALDVFFDRLDEFRKFQPIRIRKCQLEGNEKESFVIEYSGDFGATTHHRKENGKMHSDYYFSVLDAIRSQEVELGKSAAWEEIPEEKLMQVYQKIN